MPCLLCMEKAYVLISCDIGTENDLVSRLKETSHIKSVIITYGDYDVVAEIEAQDESDIDAIIISKIRKLEKIRSTITLRVTD